MRAPHPLAAATAAAVLTAGAITLTDRGRQAAPVPPAPAAAQGVGRSVTTAGVVPGTKQVAPNEQVRLLTNTFRATVGCGPLRPWGKLQRVAARHSRDMATRGYFDHNTRGGPTWDRRIRAGGINAFPIAENIAFGFTGPTAPVDVVRAWIASPGHRANLANCRLKRVGVANVAGYWTQDFSG